MSRLIGIVGVVMLLVLAYLLSTNRRAIRWRTVGLGLALQVVFALFVLRVEWGRLLFQKAGDIVTQVLQYAFAGSEFVFGEIGAKNSKLGFSFAFQVLPTIIFVSALFAVLYHFGIMQFIIRQMAKLMARMGASGAESLDVAASIFMGQTEAPLTIRPYLPSLTRSELMTVMTAGMAHVSGGIMGAYILFGIEAKHLLLAETETPLTVAGHNPPGAQAAAPAEVNKVLPHRDENVLGAIARGTTDGLNLAINVAAMLIAFLALIALANGILGGIHNHVAGWFPASLEKILGVIFAPVA